VNSLVVPTVKPRTNVPLFSMLEPKMDSGLKLLKTD